VGGLHGVADDAAHVGGECLEVELVAQPRPERLQRLRRVVAAAVEATVDDRLDARPRGPEQRGHGERRDRGGEAGAADGEADEHHAAEIGGGEGRGQRAVDERAPDHDVDVVEVVAQDRHGDREREAEDDAGEEERPADVADRHPDLLADRRRGESAEEDAEDERDPLELLALDARGAAQPHDDARQRGQHDAAEDHVAHRRHRPQRVARRPGDRERVDQAAVLAERQPLRAEREGERGERHEADSRPHDRPPARRR
jgi:hypothetical protein